MRDYALSSTFDIKFTSRRFSTGAPFTLAGSPAIAAYPDDSTPPLTAGLTLTTEFDGVTGLNNVHVVASGANGYVAGSSYALVLSSGTVDGVSVAGEVVGEFSIEAQSPLRPATAGRTLVVDAAGLAKADMVAIDGSATSAARLRRSASLIHDGAVTGAATTTTLIDSGLTHPDDDQLKGRILIFDGNVTAGLREQATDIVAFTAATNQLAFTALTQTPAVGDTFVIV